MQNGLALAALGAVALAGFVAVGLWRGLAGANLFAVVFAGPAAFLAAWATVDALDRDDGTLLPAGILVCSAIVVAVALSGLATRD